MTPYREDVDRELDAEREMLNASICAAQTDRLEAELTLKRARSERLANMFRFQPGAAIATLLLGFYLGVLVRGLFQ
jgi:hypothetical protein